MTDIALSSTVASGSVAFPLSFAQQRLFFLDRLDPGSSLYNMPLRLRLRGSFDRGALDSALTRIVERHEALRTRLGEQDGEPIQVIFPAAQLTLEFDDVGDAADPEGAGLELAAAEGNRPFDLAGGPLFRGRLVRLADDDHLLLLTAHHAVMDGWSLSLFLRELEAFYRVALLGGEAEVPELPVQYVDYAVWQRDWLQGDRLEEELSYWRDSLGGAPPLLELPTDRPRPAVQTDRGAHVRGMLSAELVERARLLASGEGATLFMVLLAAFAALMSRYAGQDDLVVGTPIANRTRLEVERLIGLFANTLALRVDLSRDPTFSELVHRVRETCLGAYEHQSLPFEKLVEELNPSRHLSHAPLFQVMFALQNHERTALDLPDLDVRSLQLDRERAKFDLALFAVEQPDGLLASFEYATDLFDASTVNRMLGHFETLLSQAVAAPQARLSELDLLTERERQEILVAWNDTAVAQPEGCLHELIATQAELTPDAVAVQCGTAAVTYRELEERANQLAQELVSRGIGCDSLVGICIDRSVELVLAMLAVLKTGGAYVPIDPTYPAERRDFILADAGVAAVLTQESLREDVASGCDATIICLDGDRLGHPGAGGPTGAPPIAHDPGQLAYVIYTSGSTGKPKGVEIRHRGVVNLVAHMRRELSVGADDVVLNLTTFAFDLSVPDFYLPLTSGARLVIVPRESVLDVERLAGELAQTGATVVQATPTTWQMLVDSGWAGLPGLRLVCGGEAVQRTLADALLGRCAELWHAYGPTETTVWSSLLRVTGGVGPTPIGGPLANTRFYVLDVHGRVCPDGVLGELWIGGTGVARGYRNRADLTSERFVPDHFVPDPEARMYGTGDLMRRRPDGTLEFMGRLDHQVKLRGYRIELGEIEAVLLEHGEVREAAVVVGSGSTGRLVAYVVADSGSAPETTALRDHVARLLPEYMVPSAFVRLERLPLTPNGKIDRRAFPDPEVERSGEERLVEPADEMEEALLELWQELLEIDEPFGVEDDFFALGGHSLLAVRLFAKIERVWGVRPPLAVLFETATVRHLAGAIRRERGRSPRWSSIVALRPGGTRPPLFLTHGIDGELLFYRDLVKNLHPDQPVYGIQGVGTDGRELPHARFEDMAEHYVQDLLRFHPDGPFLIVGYCFAGVLAYEVARQLHAHGRATALLGLIDAFPFGHHRSETRAEMERRKFADFRSRDLLGKVAWIRRRWNGLVYKVKTRGRWLLFDRLSRARWPVPRFLWTMALAGERARSSYVVPTAPCKVTLFRAGEPGRRAAIGDTSLWRDLAEGGVDIRWIEADGIRHDNIFVEPYAEVLARELTRALDEATAGFAER